MALLLKVSKRYYVVIKVPQESFISNKSIRKLTNKRKILI